MADFITDEDYRAGLSSAVGNAFLFFGSEDYLKAAAVRATREALCPDPSMAFFNDIVIDATDYTDEKLLDTMAAPPMMTDARLIVLRGFDFTTIKASELDGLLETLALVKEYDYNCIIIEVAADLIDEGYLPKKPSAILKKIAKSATPVRFEAPTGARLARWVGKHFAHHGVAADPAVCTAFVEYAGNTMFVLANEVEKLSAYVKAHGKAAVTIEDIRTVTVPATLPDAFALSNAILAGDGKAALDALAVMKFERVEPTVILGEISRTFTEMQCARVLFDAGKNVAEVAAVLKLHEYKARLLSKALAKISPARLARVIALAASTDLALKRSAGDYSLIETLIAAI
ncbi:MAG: DNA polymerase III subunit delta [Clostridia bacterium]|nr:DNA polymerase III subunit delta [Clostridia bacterium]